MSTPSGPPVLSDLTREYLSVDVEHPDMTVAQLNGLGVAWQFLPTREARPTVEASWLPGGWHPGRAVARFLLGPGGGVALPVGTHHAWVRLTGATERPVRYLGTVKIT